MLGYSSSVVIKYLASEIDCPVLTRGNCAVQAAQLPLFDFFMSSDCSSCIVCVQNTTHGPCTSQKCKSATSAFILIRCKKRKTHMCRTTTTEPRMTSMRRINCVNKIVGKDDTESSKANGN